LVLNSWRWQFPGIDWGILGPILKVRF